MTEPAVLVEDLTIQRGGRRVFDRLSCSVDRGVITGLLGPSGGGKSTLIRAIVGVQQIQSGQVSVLGQPAGSIDLRHRVGYVTQAPAVYADLSVLENLRYFARILGAPQDDVSRVLAEVGLVDFADRPAASLSGGQHSRVSLGVALLGSPELLVLDEPTVGLDPQLRRDLWDMFAAQAQRGVTLLISSHVMDEASRCDSLLLLRQGEILAHDTLPGLLERTETSDVESAFLTLVESDSDTGGPQ